MTLLNMVLFLENVVVDEDGDIDFDDNQYTENTRAAYPIDHIENIVTPSKAAHPNTFIFLTADAFGTPLFQNCPRSSMSFLDGFTAKLAGTEHWHVASQISFSTCFGSPSYL